MATLLSRFGDLITAIGADVKAIKTTPASYATLPAGSTITLTKPSGGTWPGVPTTRTDVIVIWKGADPSPSIVASRTLNSAGLLNGVDFRLVV
jgi:hypothetical protein